MLLPQTLYTPCAPEEAAGTLKLLSRRIAGVGRRVASCRLLRLSQRALLPSHDTDRTTRPAQTTVEPPVSCQFPAAEDAASLLIRFVLGDGAVFQGGGP